MSNNFNKSWLIKTTQSWKILVFFILMCLVVAIFFIEILAINNIWKFIWINEVNFSIIQVSIGLGSLVWFCQSIKCPKCGYKPVWPILRTVPANEWLVYITNLEECPNCANQKALIEPKKRNMNYFISAGIIILFCFLIIMFLAYLKI